MITEGAWDIPGNKPPRLRKPTALQHVIQQTKEKKKSAWQGWRHGLGLPPKKSKPELSISIHHDHPENNDPGTIYVPKTIEQKQKEIFDKLRKEPKLQKHDFHN